jgi:hypothetical protein
MVVGGIRDVTEILDFISVKAVKGQHQFGAAPCKILCGYSFCPNIL